MNSKTFHCQNEKRQLAAGVFFDLKNNEVGGIGLVSFYFVVLLL